MGEQYISRKTVMDEIVGVVGTLSDQRGSSVKDIDSVLKSLHGPFSVRLSTIQSCLSSCVSSGVLACKNRRYKVCKQSYGNEQLRDTDSRKFDDKFSFASDSVQSDHYLSSPDEELSDSASEFCVEELENSSCSDNVSTCSSLSDLINKRSLTHSKPKPRKRKAKRNLNVKFSVQKKNVAKENDTVMEDTVQIGGEEVNECSQQGLASIEGLVNNDDEAITKKEDDKGIRNKEDEGIKNKEESEEEDKASYDNMAKIMFTVLERVSPFGHSNRVKTHETPRKDATGMLSTATSLIENITKVMTRVAGGEVPQNATPVNVLENNDIPDSDESQARSEPSCSTNDKVPETVKGEKRTTSPCKRNTVKKFKK